MRLLKFKLNRDHVLCTLEGPSFRFKKGEVTLLPPRYAPAAISIGAEAVDGDEAVNDEIKAEMAREQAATGERLERLRACVQRLVDRNQSGDFTAGGKPNKKKVENLLGGPVGDEELAQVFDLIKQSV